MHGRFLPDYERENCQIIMKDYMLDYLIALFDDSNDFSSWAAKASHAVLLCWMEHGEVTSWLQTKLIGSEGLMPKNMLFLLRRLLDLKNSGKIKNLRKYQNQCPVSILMTTHRIFPSIMRQKGFYRHICCSCFAQDGKVNVHSALECKQNEQKTINKTRIWSINLSYSQIVTNIRSVVVNLVDFNVDLYITIL